MIKKIKITKEYKTIPKDFELDLEKITVITGENNSGKTNFIQAINSRKDTKFINAEFLNETGASLTPSIVYIAAENIKPSDSESKSSAKTTGLIKNLSELFSNLGIKFELENKEDIKGYIKNLIDKTNENLKDFVGRLKKARLEAGLTQVVAAKKLKRPQSYISKVEAGEQRLDIVEIKKFATLYKKDIIHFTK
ncbi:MAG: helix-turn-helix domain-containing protein [Patescibacteria group bacterium]